MNEIEIDFYTTTTKKLYFIEQFLIGKFIKDIAFSKKNLYRLLFNFTVFDEAKMSFLILAIRTTYRSIINESISSIDRLSAICFRNYKKLHLNKLISNLLIIFICSTFDTFTPHTKIKTFSLYKRTRTLRKCVLSDRQTEY